MRQDRSRETTPTDEYGDFYTQVGLLTQRCRGDAGLRERLAGDGGQGELRKLGIEPSVPGMELRIVADTEETTHLVFPPDPDGVLSDEALLRVAGGSTASSALSIGSAASFACSTAPSTVSSASSASTAGSVDTNPGGGINRS